MGYKRVTRRRFLAAAGLAAGLAGCNAPTSEGSGKSGELINSTPEESSVYTRVYRDTIDSVVLVRIFDDGNPSGQGSGFVYDESHIVTNEHVVSDSTDVQVRFTEGGWRQGNVVGTDVYSDIAAIQIDNIPDRASPLNLIEGEVAVGQQVVAIGNPFGLSGSISSGIVSGVDRTLPAANNFSIPDAIQTDAAVNPGNSGGPLMTLDGTVAGVINSGSGDNIGFAISAALMRRVVPALIEDGSYEHPYMGVQLTDVTPAIAAANDLNESKGVYIDTVIEGSPAEGVIQGSSGEQQIGDNTVPVGGDVIIEMGDESILSRQELSTYLALATSPGETIPVDVIRDGSRQTVQLTLGSRPDP